MQRLCRALNVKLHNIPLDLELVYDIQRAFLFSGVPDVDIASDHIIQATYLDLARDLKLTYLLYGVNYRTETHGVRAWSQGHADWTYIKGIHRRFGTQPTVIPHYAMWRLLWHRLIKTPKLIPLLNYLEYYPAQAMQRLHKFCGYEPYGGKHGENAFTRWFQGMYLPARFGYDKRKCHLSNLVCAGEYTRDEALQQLQEIPYDSEVMADDTGQVMNHLDITPAEWKWIICQPVKRYEDYPRDRLLPLLIWLRRMIGGRRQ